MFKRNLSFAAALSTVGVLAVTGTVTVFSPVLITRIPHAGRA